MSKKLIIVGDAYNAILIEAVGLKIKKVLSRYNIKDFNLLREHNEHKENFSQKMGASSHNLDPHKESKVIEREQFVAKILEIVEKLLVESSFEEILIAADAKTLGEFNAKLSDKTKSKVTKTLSKDLVKHDLSHIESEIFH